MDSKYWNRSSAVESNDDELFESGASWYDDDVYHGGEAGFVNVVYWEVGWNENNWQNRNRRRQGIGGWKNCW